MTRRPILMKRGPSPVERQYSRVLWLILHRAASSNLGQTCVEHFRFLSCNIKGRNANSLRVQHDASRRVLLTMPARDSAPGLYLLQVAQFLIFERQYIFEAVNRARR